MIASLVGSIFAHHFIEKPLLDEKISRATTLKAIFCIYIVFILIFPMRSRVSGEVILPNLNLNYEDDVMGLFFIGKIGVLRFIRRKNKVVINQPQIKNSHF